MIKVPSFIVAMIVTASALAQNVTTSLYDPARSGANTAETTLTPANVNSTQFGKLCSYLVAPSDGLTPADQYAQPLIVRNVNVPGQGTHDVVYTATQANDVFAFDANCLTSAPLWRANLGPPIPATETPGTDNSIRTPGPLGVMGTPVIDTATGTLYVVSRTKPNATNYAYKLHALDIGTGAEKLGGPTTIAAMVPGTGYDATPSNTIIFNAYTQNHRAGLALACGRVYFAFGSYADNAPYHGWVMAYDASTLQQVAAFNVSPNGQAGAVWQSGGAPAIDGSCNVYLATGNGSFNGTTDFGESLLKLSPTLTLLGWYRPADGDLLDAFDLDFGTAPTTLIPAIDAAVQGGKDGGYHIVRMSNPTELSSGLQATLSELHSQVVWTSPQGLRLYQWAGGEPLHAFTWNGTAFVPTDQSTMFAALGQPGGILSLSSNGTGAGIVWSCMPYSDDAEHNVTGGICRAFDANNLANELWNSRQVQSRDGVGSFAKFVMPVVSKGKLYVATFSNFLHVCGLLPASPITYRISGVVTSDGAPLAGVSFTTVNGGSCTASDANGSYACTLPGGWAGTITPAKAGYGFTPGSRTYSNLQADSSGQSFTASPVSAVLMITDTVTEGNWRGTYGSDGYAVIDDSTSYPAYARVTLSGQSDFIWDSQPADVRALQRASSPGRIAAALFSATSFDVDVSFTDTAVHQVALYLLDWDSTTRVTRIDVLDAAALQVLATQAVASYHNGTYLTWSVQGHVVFRLTNVGGSNALLSGIFFGMPGSGLVTTTTTVASSANPAAAGTAVTFTATVIGNAPTGSVNFTDGGASLAGCAAVALAGAGNGRTAACTTSGLAVGTHPIAASYGGDAGNVASTSATLLQAITPAATGTVASFVGVDAATEGDWPGRYGSDGYVIVGDSVSYPSYASATPSGKNDLVWASRSNDSRALQRAVARGRIAASWYAPSAFSVDVDPTDQRTHRVSLYLLDWDTTTRVTRIDVLDAVTQQLLSTQTAQGYHGGTYLTWSVKGHIAFRLTNLGGPSAVLSGVFFDTPLENPLTVGGRVTSATGPLAGVSFTVPKPASCSASDASGQYTCLVPSGWSATLTPALSGYTFTPASRSYSNVTANQTGQDYVGASRRRQR